mgnify:FL=1
MLKLLINRFRLVITLNLERQEEKPKFWWIIIQYNSPQTPYKSGQAPEGGFRRRTY